MKKVLGFLQSAYRSRLYRLYILNAPGSIAIPWKVAKAFLEQHTVDKIKIFKKSTTKNLWEHFNPNQIEQKFGGNVPDLESNFWPPKCTSTDFSLENENQEDRLATVEEYREKHKAGLIDPKFVHHPYL